ncbi:hypothetical protein [Salipiger marinus]|uniref:hypothetical protein n=1 Tax=Salipiger marinus TaxID=555512 RepID=UPI001A956598
MAGELAAVAIGHFLDHLPGGDLGIEQPAKLPAALRCCDSSAQATSDSGTSASRLAKKSPVTSRATPIRLRSPFTRVNMEPRAKAQAVNPCSVRHIRCQIHPSLRAAGDQGFRMCRRDMQLAERHHAQESGKGIAPPCRAGVSIPARPPKPPCLDPRKLVRLILTDPSMSRLADVQNQNPVAPSRPASKRRIPN